jgi:hypothetical protein
LLIVLGTGTAMSRPAQAAQLPAGCGASSAVNGGSVAVNAAAAEVAAGLQGNSDATTSVLVCTSAGGQTWSAPVTLGQGANPAVALAPNGRAVAAWEGGPYYAPVVEASVLPPGGTWSAPVAVGADARAPVIGIDGSDNAIVAWPGATGTVHTASLPAGGSWTAVQTLATRGSGVDLAVNSTGTAIISWAVTGSGAFADSGTVLGGFAAPVKVGGPPYKGGLTNVALNNAGQAALAWATSTENVAATRSATGAWTTPADLSAVPDGPLDVAIDGAGDAIAVFGETHVTGSPRPPRCTTRSVLPMAPGDRRRYCLCPATPGTGHAPSQMPQVPSSSPGQTPLPGLSTCSPARPVGASGRRPLSALGHSAISRSPQVTRRSPSERPSPANR